MEFLRFRSVRSYPRLLLLFWAAAGALAKADPATLNSHEVQADQSVTFRYLGPGAKQVTLSMDYDATPLPMHKGGDGVWTYTTKPLAPELHFYTFLVDGVALRDPQNPDIEANLFYVNNTVRVSGSSAQLWDVTSVPHGIVHHHTYTSQIIKGLAKGAEEYYVYTPPGYDPSGTAHYPVLYLLHGWGARADDWVEAGQANLILDNLIAQDRAVPMIVVMPQNYGNMSFAQNGPGVWDDPRLVAENISRFGFALLHEIAPQVEQAYRVTGDHAITGLSMGGAQSLLIGLNHPEYFSWVGGFSSTLNYESFGRMFPGMSAKKPPRLIWVACGTGDEDLTSSQRFVAWLKTKGQSPTAVETLGSHNWHTWRDNLIHFVPLLFTAPVATEVHPAPAIPPDGLRKTP